jgi:hypothetical protein
MTPTSHPHRPRPPGTTAAGGVPDDPTTRKRLRMQGWDFTSPGWCFLTLCTQNMRSEFGAVVNGHMKLNEAEHVADIFRRETPAHFPRTAWCNQYVLAHCERAACSPASSTRPIRKWRSSTYDHPLNASTERRGG